MARTKFCSLATLWQISLYFIPRWNLFYFVRAYLHFFCLQKYCEAAQIVCGLPLWNMLLRIASSPNPQTCTFNFYSTGAAAQTCFFPHVVFIHHLHFLSWLCSRSFQFEVITRHVIKQGDERLNLPMYKKKKRMHSQIFVLHTLFFFFFSVRLICPPSKTTIVLIKVDVTYVTFAPNLFILFKDVWSAERSGIALVSGKATQIMLTILKVAAISSG